MGCGASASSRSHDGGGGGQRHGGGADTAATNGGAGAAHAAAGRGGAGGGRGGGRGGGGGNSLIRQEPPWKYDDHDLTEYELECMRAYFWEGDKPGGTKASWESLQVAAEAMQNDDVDLANTVTRNMGLATPDGNLGRCIDRWGHVYELPRYVYSTPTNVFAGVVGPASKAPPVTGPPAQLDVVVRVAYRATERDLTLRMSSAETVGTLRTRLHEQLGKEEEDAADEYRLFFSGRELSDDSLTLERCNFELRTGCIVQALPRPSREALAAAAAEVIEE